MSVIQKIRNKYGKLAGFTIAFALVGFILMDAASGKFGDMFGHDNSVAKVNGEKIDNKEYAQRIKEYEIIYNYSQKGKQLTDEVRAQLHEQALKDLVYEKIVAQQSEKLGIGATKEEENDLIYGTNPDPVVQQYPYFANRETGMFDPQMVKQFEKVIDQQDKTGKVRDEWEAIKSYVKRTHKTQKFNALLGNSFYAPTYMLEQQQKEQLSMCSIHFVKVPFTTINDNEIKVTDEDMLAYMTKHKDMYSSDQPSRNIDYITYDVVPSKEDSSKALDKLTSVKSDFVAASSKDAENIVNRNSDDQFSGTFVTKKSFMSPYADSILGLSVGSVYGPYLENGNYKMVKVLEKREMPDSVKAQHILIGVSKDRDDSAAIKLVDSLKLAIEKGASFDSLAARFSEDKGSKDKGGDLGYFGYGVMVAPFNDACFMGSKGDMKRVKTQFGEHLLRVNDQKNFQSAAKLGIITKALAAGEATTNAMYSKAVEFAGKNTTEKAFDDAIKAQNLNKKVAENVKVNDFVVQGIGSAREIIRWMYDSKLGAISSVFTIDNRYIIAKVASMQEANVPKLTAANRPQIEAIVKAQKKAEKIAAKYKGMATLDALAQASQQPMQNVDSISMAKGFIPNLGFEPKVIGYSFCKSLSPNAVSPGIKGMDGVLFISLVGRQELPANPNTQEPIKQKRMMMMMQNRGAIGQMEQENLRKTSEITYNGANLY
jgi:peptidyl-prolyl cis-trans isomerase D